MSGEVVLREAEFNPSVRWYWLSSVALVMVASIIGAPLALIWLVVGRWATTLYLRRLRFALTTRAVKLEKGVLNRLERTVPLDRITDVSLAQGPVMRFFGVEKLSVETAGQSSQGALLNVTGVRDGRAFRDAILTERDRVTELHAADAPEQAGAPAGVEGATEVLAEIRDSVVRIEATLANRE